MHNDNYSDDYFNVNQALDTIGGVANQLIQAKAAGQQLTANQQQIAANALAMQQALNQQAQAGTPGGGLSGGGMTTAIVLGSVALLVIFMVFKFTK
jgi:hypothetical protein